MKGQRIGSAEQLRRWVDGEAIHRALPGYAGGECVPDFSCCAPPLLQPPEVRQAFAQADRTRRNKFLVTFLAALMAHKKLSHRVHIAGRAESDTR